MRYQMIMVSESEILIELLLHLASAIACILIIMLFLSRYRKTKNKKTGQKYLGLTGGFALLLAGQLMMLYWTGSFFLQGISNWHSPQIPVAMLNLTAIAVIGWYACALKKTG